MATEDIAVVTAAWHVSIREALQVIDDTASSTCLLVDEDGVLRGLLSDGDARRALLQGASLDSPALPHATEKPVTVAEGTSRALVLDLMSSLRMSAVPEIDAAGRVRRLHTLREMIGARPISNTAVIMAGGRGTRLGSLTKDKPKPLMTVAGRPILEWIVLGLVSEGIRDIVVSVNHLSAQIIDQLGDGAPLGCAIRYLQEDEENPLGTAGSLSLLRKQRPDIVEPLIVMNGDLMVEFEVRKLLEHHHRHHAQITVGSRHYDHQVPFGVLDLDDQGHVISVSEKPHLRVTVNTAIYVVEPVALDRLPYNQPSTMPDLIEWCIEDRARVVSYPLAQEWIDIGTPTDLARAQGKL